MTTVGVISDTHNLLRPEAVKELIGSDLIVHAGDIGSAEIIRTLTEIAPVQVVRGNNDTGLWAAEYPEHEMFIVEGKRFYLIHDIRDMRIDPVEAGLDVVVTGHSHQPAIRSNEGVLYINPGSAGPRRFNLPISLATVRINGKTIEAEICSLEM